MTPFFLSLKFSKMWNITHVTLRDKSEVIDAPSFVIKQ